jgi:hypothetical protein
VFEVQLKGNCVDRTPNLTLIGVEVDPPTIHNTPILR